MNKSQDEFSSNSYDELLKKYGGESVPSKPVKNTVDATYTTPAQRQHTQRTSNNPTDAGNAQRPPITRTSNTFSSGMNANPNGNKHSFDIDLLPRFEETEQKTNIPVEPQGFQPRKEKFLVNIDHAKDFASGVASKVKTIASNTRAEINSRMGRNGNIDQDKAENNTGANGDNTNKSDKKDFDINDIAGSVINLVTKHKTQLIVVACCLLVSIILSSCILSCVNDILAINRKGEETIEVVLPEDVDTFEAIRILDKAGLIKNSLFCNAFVKAMGFTDDNYLPGIYYFTDDMGVEKMLTRFKTSSTRGAVISITIPEGYTVDQIFQRLEKNKVCSADSLYRVLQTVDFGNEYDFIAKLENTDERYCVLEGYMFPATYEFEQGAEPASVIRKFLDAFKSRWTEEYAAKATELGMSVDEVINLASILEKEGTDKQQFTQISSVLHNRLNRPGVYPTLECNSTKDYVKNTVAKRASSPMLKKFIVSYSTYDSPGLPPSAICNPGAEAIDAALNPEISQNYFFRHDKNNKIYLAKTLEEHSANGRIVEKVNAEK